MMLNTLDSNFDTKTPEIIRTFGTLDSNFDTRTHEIIMIFDTLNSNFQPPRRLKL